MKAATHTTPDDFVEKFSGMDLEFTPGDQIQL
jgi:hypothetical protein